MITGAGSAAISHHIIRPVLIKPLYPQRRCPLSPSCSTILAGFVRLKCSWMAYDYFNEVGWAPYIEQIHWLVASVFTLLAHWCTGCSISVVYLLSILFLSKESLITPLLLLLYGQRLILRCFLKTQGNDAPLWGGDILMLCQPHLWYFPDALHQLHVNQEPIDPVPWTAGGGRGHSHVQSCTLFRSPEA